MILVNGQPAQCISPHDRGFNYGDGIFETIAVHGGEALCWSAHMARLRRGGTVLGIPVPDESLLQAEVAGLIAGCRRAVLKVVLTRGIGGRGYAPPADPWPCRVLSVHAWPESPAADPAAGVSLEICATLLSTQRVLAGIKHLNRLEQVLAKQELNALGCSDGLMQDADGRIIEATSSNLFLVGGATLVTPLLDHCGIAGIVRGEILARAGGWGMETRVCEVREADLQTADEMFLCNSIIGVRPVNRVRGREFAAGPVAELVSRRLADAKVIAPA